MNREQLSTLHEYQKLGTDQAARGELQQWLLEQAAAAGLETTTHSFCPTAIPSGCSSNQLGTNIVAVARSGRGDGKEALVITVRYTGLYHSSL